MANITFIKKLYKVHIYFVYNTVLIALLNVLRHKIKYTLSGTIYQLLTSMVF